MDGATGTMQLYEGRLVQAEEPPPHGPEAGASLVYLRKGKEPV